MRRTVTLDPDTERIVRERMAADGVDFDLAPNAVIRAGADRADSLTFRTPTFDLGQPVIDLTHSLRLAGELDDAAIVESMRTDG